MANFGARNSMWAPWAAESPDTNPAKLPKYGEAVSIGKLNKASDSINFVEGNLSGDDSIALYEKLFKDGTVEVHSVYLSLGQAAEMHGCAVNEKKTGLAFGSDDQAPYGGYGCTTTHVAPGKKYHQAIFYPKVRATAPTGDNYETRGENITFNPDKINLHLEEPACKKYKIVEDFDTEEAAKAYLEALFAGTAAVAGLPETGSAEPESASTEESDAAPDENPAT